MIESSFSTCSSFQKFDNVDMANDKDDILKLVQQAEDLLVRVKYLLLRDTANFPEEAQKMLDQRICLGCGKRIPKTVRVFRGNHERCYRRTYRKIQDGKISDREAVDAELLSPAAPGGKIRKSTHLDEYLTIREKEGEDYSVKRTGKKKSTKKKKDR